MVVTVLAYCLLGWYSFIVTLALTALYTARKRYSHPPQPSPLANLSRDQVPGVSILRPLRGLDCNLYENLEASFLQDYPNFEIIFSVADEDDVAIPLVRELLEKYPDVRARIIIGEETVGVNPKINNLILSYRTSTSDILWVLDSNVLTHPGCLSRSVSLLTRPSIGLVHHVPFALYPDSNLGSRVEQVFLCTTHAKMYIAINAFGIASCVTGKSCLYRKSDLERATRIQREKKRKSRGLDKIEAGEREEEEEEEGLASFGQYLGEDNMIGEAIWNDLGLGHAIGEDLAGNTVGTMSLDQFFRRRVRWIRVRKYMVLLSTLIEPLTECFFLGLLLSLSLSHLYSLSPLLTLPLHTLLWHLTDSTLYTFLLPSSPSRTVPRPSHDGPGSLAFVFAWFVREGGAGGIWAFAMMGNTVRWRENGRGYRVRKDGTVREVQEGGGGGWVEVLWAEGVERVRGWGRRDARGEGWRIVGGDLENVR